MNNAFKKTVLISILLSPSLFLQSAQAETVNDILQKNKTVAQTVPDASIKKAPVIRFSPPPPKMIAIRGVDDKITATFEFETSLADASAESPDIGDGWKFVSAVGGKIKIRYGNDAPVVVRLSGRASSAATVPNNNQNENNQFNQASSFMPGSQMRNGGDLNNPSAQMQMPLNNLPPSPAVLFSGSSTPR